MFLKRERPETDDFAIKEISDCERKKISIFQEMLADTLTKIF